MTTTTAPLPDTELLRQMRSGTAAAFQALYRRHQGPLYRFATLRCGSPDLAADVVQEVFMGVLTGALRFDPLRGQLQHFLFGVARNLILKHEQARGRTASLPDSEDGEDDDSGDYKAEPLARMLSNEVADDVRRALAQLSPHYRDSLILYEMHDLSYQEIAAICQVDIGTVRSRLSRARALLAKRLGMHRPNTINA